MNQEEILKAMESYITNECSSIEESSNFAQGVLWAIKKMQKSGMFEDNTIDIGKLYDKVLKEKMIKKN